MRAGDRVAAAVSGGADSVALLRMLLELRAELGIVVSVAHFNHALRGEASDADEAFVAELTRQHDLEFFSSRTDVRDHALTSKLSLEAAARDLRYRWLGSLPELHNLNEVATGHTLDDQAETVLLKFLRGAGTRGLAGIYPEIASGAKQIAQGRKAGMSSAEADSFLRTNGLEAGLKARTTRTSLLSATSEGLDVFQSAECGPEGPLNRDSCQPGACIVRPLLGVTREEVEKYLAALGQTWREDESNLDHRFARNRLRHELLPLLEREYNPNIRQVLSDAAELSRAEEEYWQALVERELQDRMAAQRLRLMNFRALPLALQRRLLRRFVETANLALDFEHVEKLLRCALGELPKAELPGGWLAVRQGGCLELLAPQVEPPFSSYQYTLPVPGEVHIAEIGLTVRCIPVPQEFAKEEPPGSLLCTELLGPELIVRNWRPGDRFWPVHSKSEEKLKRLFSEKHVPAGQRPRWPVVLKGEQIVWVRGFPVSRAFAWSGSGDAVRIELLVST